MAKIQGIHSFEGNVGDIRPAMLSEALYQSKYGAGWILADGRNVAGSKYAALIASTVPDLRSVNLRGKDNARGLNPDGDLALGAFQSDNVATHNHGGATNTDGAHTHSNAPSQSGAANYGTQQTVISDQPGAGGGTPVVQVGGSSHAHGIPSFGGNETRSKSVTVNHFIKIN